MNLIKKDWMYDLKTVAVLAVSALALISVIYLVWAGIIPEYRWVFKKTYEEIYVIAIGAMGIYPLWAFTAISPQIKNGKVYLNTANLPLSKKRLFFQGLKPWLIAYPVVILATSAVMAALNEPTRSFGTLFLFSLVRPSAAFVFMTLMTMQVIAGIIFCSVKKIKWYKIIGIMVIFNGILIGLCVLAGLVLPVDADNSMWFAAGVVLTMLLGSLGVFLTAWKDVEKIHQ